MRGNDSNNWKVLEGQCDGVRLAGGTMPFMRKYSIICP